MIRSIRTIIVGALPILALALMTSAGTVPSYTGNWPVTVSQSRWANGTYCLTLTDNGTFGWPHSGEASLSGAKVGGTLPYGTFQVINGLLVATIQSSGDSGQNAGIVFTGPGSNGTIHKGVYEEVYGGEELDSGVAVFGAVGGCSGSE